MKLSGLLLCWCLCILSCKKEKNYGKLSGFIKETGIRNADDVYVMSDNSCNICFQVLEEDAKRVKDSTNRFLLVMTDKKKFSYDDFFLKQLFPRSNLFVVSSDSLLKLMADKTGNIKGPYKIAVDNDVIVEISVVSHKE